jgi:hypothetical protein
MLEPSGVSATFPERVPERVSRGEDELGEDHDVGAFLGGLVEPGADLLGRRLQVLEHDPDLDCRH